MERKVTFLENKIGYDNGQNTNPSTRPESEEEDPDTEHF